MKIAWVSINPLASRFITQTTASTVRAALDAPNMLEGKAVALSADFKRGTPSVPGGQLNPRSGRFFGKSRRVFRSKRHKRRKQILPTWVIRALLEQGF